MTGERFSNGEDIGEKDVLSNEDMHKKIPTMREELRDRIALATGLGQREARLIDQGVLSREGGRRQCSSVLIASADPVANNRYIAVAVTPESEARCTPT